MKRHKLKAVIRHGGGKGSVAMAVVSAVLIEIQIVYVVPRLADK